MMVKGLKKFKLAQLKHQAVGVRKNGTLVGMWGFIFNSLFLI